MKIFYKNKRRKISYNTLMLCTFAIYNVYNVLCICYYHQQISSTFLESWYIASNMGNSVYTNPWQQWDFHSLIEKIKLMTLYPLLMFFHFMVDVFNRGTFIVLLRFYFQVGNDRY
jgi:hypothetical protein